MKNYGIEILRMILCFWVVLFHYLRQPDSKLLKNLKSKMFHVPSFFFISFFFLFPLLKTKNTKKMLLRLERISIPYFGWPIIIWILNKIFALFCRKLLIAKILPFIILIKQLIGRKFLVHLWFLFNLLIVTIVLFIITLIFEIKNFMKICQMLLITFYILQYSKYNYFFFDNYNHCISHSVGHLVESFPIAFTAVLINYTGVINRLKSFRNMVIFYCIIFNFFIYHYNVFKNIETYSKKYNYNGFDKIFFPIFTFVILIPFENIQFSKIYQKT